MSGEDAARPLLLAGDDPPVVAIIRRLAPDAATAVAHALAAAGIPALEVTVDSPGALSVVARLRSELGAGTRVGVGTVLDAADVPAIAAAGAQFIVSPHVDPAVIEAGVAAGLAVVPGAATPTEMLGAWRAGASLVKLFPAGVLGPGMIRAIAEPLAMIPVIAVGGVDAANAPEFLAAGARAVGIGSWLSGAGDPQLAGKRARTLLARVGGCGDAGG